MAEKKCVIEFQAFRNNENGFIIKELVVLDLSTSIVSYFLFKPPCSSRSLLFKQYRTNKWLTSFFHRISWNEGFVEYTELENIMYHYCDQFKMIYTSGNEKSRFIQQFTKNPVICCSIPKNNDLNNHGVCIGVKDVNHNFSQNCALVKAYSLASIISRK